MTDSSHTSSTSTFYSGVWRLDLFVFVFDFAVRGASLEHLGVSWKQHADGHLAPAAEFAQVGYSAVGCAGDSEVFAAEFNWVKTAEGQFRGVDLALGFRRSWVNSQRARAKRERP